MPAPRLLRLRGIQPGQGRDYPLSRIVYPPDEFGPENIGRTTGWDWRQTDQPALPPVQGRELGPENVGRTTGRDWLEADQPPLPPVSPPPSAGIGSDVRFPLAPWTTNMPPTGFASGGGGIGGDWRFPEQQVDERLLPASAPADTSLPPSRPTGGGGGAARGGAGGGGAGGGGQGRTPAPAAPPVNPGTLVQYDVPGSGYRQGQGPIYTAANFGGSGGGGLLGGLGRLLSGAVGAPAAATPAATSAGRTALRAPSNDDWTFDAQGNPIPTFPNTNMTTDELSRAINKPGWLRRLGG
jgi:hypothetical protein